MRASSGISLFLHCSHRTKEINYFNLSKLTLFLLKGIFLSSIVVIVFNKNGPIRIHYLHVSGRRGRSLSASVMSHTHDL